MPRPREVGPLRHDAHRGFLRGALHVVYDLMWVLGALMISPWLLWRWVREPGFRRLTRERLTLGPHPALPSSGRPRILVHGVSVGEIKAALTLVQRLEARHPEYEVLMSATTDTGLQVARESAREGTLRFPLDHSWPVRRFLRRASPVCVILLELEIWPNFLRESNRRGIPVAVVNGRITEDSFRGYRSIRRLLPQFDRITLFCAQDESYAARFRELSANADRVLVTGNMKADGHDTGPVDPGPELRRLLGGAAGQPVLVAGSTHDPEEHLVTQAWQQGAPDARLVLVPRHPVRAPELVRSLAAVGVRAQRLTDLRAGREQPDPTRPVIADTVGELERVYALADLVFVGGSLIPHGGQNMLEPAAQGLPVIFGPHVDNFVQEARLLLEAGACVQVADTRDLAATLRRLLHDTDAKRAMGTAGRKMVESQKGATALTLAALSARCLGIAVGAQVAGSRPGTEPAPGRS